MNEAEVHALFRPLWDDLKEEDFNSIKPFLAHYTSLEVIESILKNEEIWFSNPLLMNDLEEVRFGILHGVDKLLHSDAIHEAFDTESRWDRYVQCLDHYTNVFEENHLFDTYIFCLSEHEPNSTDGHLSMWRGYGNDGKGAALVFDTSKITPIPDSPLIIGKVAYGSGDDRLAWIEGLEKQVATILKTNSIPDDQIHTISHLVLERIKLFALFSKHIGFDDEREWRVVYLSDRDQNGMLKSMLNYHIGSSGIEPKLRFKIGAIAGVSNPGLTLESILCQVILGPSQSTEMAKRSMQRMFEVIGKPQLKNILYASEIPFRPS